MKLVRTAREYTLDWLALNGYVRAHDRRKNDGLDGQVYASSEETVCICADYNVIITHYHSGPTQNRLRIPRGLFLLETSLVHNVKYIMCGNYRCGQCGTVCTSKYRTQQKLEACEMCTVVRANFHKILIPAAVTDVGRLVDI